MISDINECEGKTHNCSSNAVCNNTKGSYNCTCKPGYEGDGNNCTGIISFLTWSFCMPSKALLFLFFHDKMLFIAIFLNSRPYYLKILNGKFTTLTYCLVFLMFCLLTWLASETLLFCFFSCISSFFSVLASLFKKRRGVHSANLTHLHC